MSLPRSAYSRSAAPAGSRTVAPTRRSTTFIMVPIIASRPRSISATPIGRIIDTPSGGSFRERISVRNGSVDRRAAQKHEMMRCAVTTARPHSASAAPRSFRCRASCRSEHAHAIVAQLPNARLQRCQRRRTGKRRGIPVQVLDARRPAAEGVVRRWLLGRVRGGARNQECAMGGGVTSRG